MSSNPPPNPFAALGAVTGMADEKTSTTTTSSCPPQSHNIAECFMDIDRPLSNRTVSPSGLLTLHAYPGTPFPIAVLDQAMKFLQVCVDEHRIDRSTTQVALQQVPVGSSCVYYRVSIPSVSTQVWHADGRPHTQAEVNAARV